MFLKRFVVAIMFVVLIVTCSACKSHTMTDSTNHTETIEQQETLLKINSSGGYILTTDTFTCTVVGDGKQLYVHSQSYDTGRIIECYVNADTVTVIESLNGNLKYTTVENHMFYLSNPLTGYINSLNSLTNYTSDVEICDDAIYNTYVFMIKEEPPQNIAYVVSDIAITWTDGQQYQFKFYDYDNIVSVSDTAPIEMQNGSDWEIDVDKKIFYNKTDNITIPISVSNISIGYGSPPSNNESNDKQIKVFVNEQTGLVDKIVQCSGVQDIEIIALQGVDVMTVPNITEEYTKMTDSEASSALLIAHTFSLLI